MAPKKEQTIDPHTLLEKTQKLLNAVHSSRELKMLRELRTSGYTVNLGYLVGHENLGTFAHLRKWLRCFAAGPLVSYQAGTTTRVDLNQGNRVAIWLANCERFLKTFLKAYPGDEIRLSEWKTRPELTTREMMTILRVVDVRPAPQNKKCKEQKCTCTVCRRGSDVKAHMEFLDKFAAPAVSEPASALKPVFEDRPAPRILNDEPARSGAKEDKKPANTAPTASEPVSTDKNEEDEGWEIVGGLEDAGEWSLVHDL